MKLFTATVATLSITTLAVCAIPGTVLAGDSSVSSARHVESGDVLYTASGISSREERAVFLAEARAARLLQIECGAVPRDSRVYRFENHHQADGSFLAEVQMGTALVDCEQTRKASPETQARISNNELQRQIAQYQGAVAAVASASSSASTASAVPAASATQPNPVQDRSLSAVLWTDEQEESHLRSIQARLKQRLSERAHIALIRQ